MIYNFFKNRINTLAQNSPSPVTYLIYSLPAALHLRSYLKYDVHCCCLNSFSVLMLFQGEPELFALGFLHNCYPLLFRSVPEARDIESQNHRIVGWKRPLRYNQYFLKILVLWILNSYKHSSMLFVIHVQNRA